MDDKIIKGIKIGVRQKVYSDKFDDEKFYKEIKDDYAKSIKEMNGNKKLHSIAGIRQIHDGIFRNKYLRLLTGKKSNY